MILEGINKEPIQPTRVWSSAQKDIFSFIKDNPTTSLCINAVAGSGKTTTILESMKYISPKERTIFLAFNKSIADELAGRVPSYVQAKTLHSLCMQIIRENAKIKLWKTKTDIMLKDLLQSCGASEEIYWQERGVVSRVVSLLKANCLGSLDKDFLKEVCLETGIVLEEETEDLIYWIWDNLHTKGGKYWNIMDFDDMLRIPLLRNFQFPKYDTVFIDEAQDLNLVQHEILARLLNEGGRIIAVGDANQAIYAFRGANNNSLSIISKAFKAKELPLYNTYRCAQSITERAAAFNPYIQSIRGEMGEVSYISKTDLKFQLKEGVDNLILCRRNAPLFYQAIELIKQGHKVYLRGRDIVPYLVSIADKVQKRYGSITRDYIEYWRIEQVQDLNTTAANTLTDATDILQVLCEEAGGRLEKKILQAQLYELLPNEKPSEKCIELSTIHKAKGLEADTVYILCPSLLPAYPMGFGQEDNLHYVAITRAKNKLVYVMEEKYD